MHILDNVSLPMLGLDADGHCMDGFSSGMVLNRYESEVSRDVITWLDQASDQQCMQLDENYQWTNFEG